MRTEKSSKYPYISLPKAIDIIQKARNFGKSTSDTNIAGTKSITSGSFKKIKAALKYYGLLSAKNNDLYITDLSDKILNPLDENEKLQAIQEAFLNVSIFQSIYISTEKNRPIDIEIIGTILIRTYNIQPKVKDAVLKNLIKSGIYSRLIEYYQDSKNKIVFLDKGILIGDIKMSINKEKNQFDNLSLPKELVEPNPESQKVEISLSTGIAKIVVPNNLSETDIKKLKLQIDIFSNNL